MGFLKNLRVKLIERKVQSYCKVIADDTSSVAKRMEAARKLGAFGPEAVSARAVLTRYFVQNYKSGSPDVLAALAGALANIGPDEQVLEPVLEILRSTNPAHNLLKITCTVMLVTLGSKAQPAANAIAEDIVTWSHHYLSSLSAAKSRLNKVGSDYRPDMWRHMVQCELDVRTLGCGLLKAICQVKPDGSSSDGLIVELKNIAQYAWGPLVGRHALLALVLHFPSSLNSLKVTDEARASAADLLSDWVKIGAVTEVEAAACVVLLATASMMPEPWEAFVTTVRKAIKLHPDSVFARAMRSGEHL